ncbi:MAG: hypothetical protein J6K19_03720 [Prevotella sp.]|nr:hypothetical protein [Prevotella sp.]
MELKEFIKTAIVDIVNAVKEAQDEVGESATIMPIRTKAHQTYDIAVDGGHERVSDIDFDIAVTIGSKEGAEGNAGGGIQIAQIFNIGAGHKENAENMTQNVSRMKFTIPIVLPHSFVPEEQITEMIGGRMATHLRRDQNNE